MKLTVSIIGYSLLAIILIFAITEYMGVQYQDIWQLDFVTALPVAAASAVVAMTVSVFWLWSEARVRIVERVFGPLGHMVHCGYCFSLWLAALCVSALHISFFGNLIQNRFFLFFASWWALGFLNILFFAIMTTVWFKKVHLEFSLRDLYKRSSAPENK